MILFFSGATKIEAQTPTIREIRTVEIDITLNDLFQVQNRQTAKLDITVVESEYQRRNRLSEEALPEVLKQIRQCESRGDYLAQNKISSASGAFQALNSTFNNYQGYTRAKDAPKYIQDQFALELYQRRGVSPWNASIHCWGKKAPQIAKSNGDLTVKPASYFIAGTCTYYVATKFLVTWGGNANMWAINARAQGYRVDKTPEAGSVMETYESSGAGHVAYIEKIENGTIFISDMNFAGKWIITERQFPANSPLIKAIIHRL